MRRGPMILFAAAFAMLSLTACGSPPEPRLLPVTQLVQDDLADSLLECPDRPPPPPPGARMSVVIGFLAAVLEAHSECRSDVQTIGRIIRERRAKAAAVQTAAPPPPSLLERLNPFR